VKKVHVASNDTAPLTFPWWTPPGGIKRSRSVAIF
jgi:hypothetical protein